LFCTICHFKVWWYITILNDTCPHAFMASGRDTMHDTHTHTHTNTDWTDCFIWTTTKSVTRSGKCTNINTRQTVPWEKAIAEFFDRYFHIPLPIVTKHELGLPFPPRNRPVNFFTNPSTIFLVIVVTDIHTDRQRDRQTNAGKTYSLAFAGIMTLSLITIQLWILLCCFESLNRPRSAVDRRL